MSTEMSEERLKILEMIDQGVINAEEGYALLQALDDDSIPDDGMEMGAFSDTADDMDSINLTSGEDPPLPPDPEDMEKWKRWWFIPVWIGAGITVIGGVLMLWAWRASGFGFWFACTWFPFLMGVMVLALGWGSQKSPWLHVRVHQKPGESPEKVAISLPIPIRLTAWLLRTFGHFIPKLDATGLDEIILALADTKDGDVPFFVDVDEGEDGEKVQVFIG
ncbi:MAG: hypothetical protein ISR58_08935 [Anaerolineales bacterium]|nr:hypothetical protein [Chloroflexota bacterium]MBL6981302.1 hypothetical protein [Anaerolineales bacterium]